MEEHTCPNCNSPLVYASLIPYGGPEGVNMIAYSCDACGYEWKEID